MAAWQQYVRWYLDGKVYRCGTPQVIPNTGISFGQT